VISPIDGKAIGTVQEGDEATVASAFVAAQADLPHGTPPVSPRAHTR